MSKKIMTFGRWKGAECDNVSKASKIGTGEIHIRFRRKVEMETLKELDGREWEDSSQSPENKVWRYRVLTGWEGARYL